MSIKQVAKCLARALLGDYGIYYVYRATATPTTVSDTTVGAIGAAEVAAARDELIAVQADYAGEGARAFAVCEHGTPLAVCFYWFGERYRQRGFWPLADDEAKLVQIVTAPGARGRGLATTLIAGSAAAMRDQGWSQLYARVWHSNDPSWRAFERAGWQRVALVVEVNPLRLARPWRMRLAA